MISKTTDQKTGLWSVLRVPFPVWVLGFASLLIDVSSEMINALLPLYLAGSLGFSIIAIGFIEGLSFAIATAVKFVSGFLVDRSPRRKPLLVVGYGLAALSRLIFPWAVALDQIVLAKAMDRVGKGIRGAPRDAIVTDVSPKDLRGASFGLRKSLDALGGLFGPLAAVAGMLYFANDIPSVFLAAAVPALVCLGLLIFLLKEPSRVAEGQASNVSLKEAVHLSKSVWVVIGLAAMVTFARFSEAFILLKAVEVDMDLAWVPLSLVLMHLVFSMAALPVGVLSDRVGPLGLLIWSLVWLLLAHLSFAMASSIWIYVLGTLLWWLHMAFSQGLLGAMIANVAPEKLRGSAFGAFNFVTGCVVLAGNTFAGLLWYVYGSSAPFYFGAALSVVAMIAVFAGRSFRQT